MLAHSVDEFTLQLTGRSAVAADDGKTACERRKGKQYKRALPQFSGAVMLHAGRKITSKWTLENQVAVFCEVEKSDEPLAGTPEGVLCACSVHRLQPG